MAKVYVGKVESEDDDFIFIRVPKRNDVGVRVSDGDTYFTIVFVRPNPEGGSNNMTDWDPFADAHQLGRKLIIVRDDEPAPGRGDE